ncbi:hypothetical protein SSAG_01032 [Streptomyces sp. Mg1]|nr:hypothetical protein M444_00390 [Streptomyces sp. Mg1]EDX21241.1 hypothetical protein SSAG_01032 [Streptomyces sp. Mg1]RPK44710.1 hypothetical protein EES37_16235 [Streptomyces sp. ADI91-18]
MGEPELRRRAAQLRRGRVEADEQGDAWAVALHTVALEDVERLGRERGVDLSGEADPSTGVHG